MDETEETAARPGPARRRIALVGLGAAALVVGLGVVAVGQDDDAVVDTMSADGRRVLQSVDVGLGSDGAIDQVSSTVVSTDADGNESTDTGRFDPRAVRDDLPVRVLTSWRTKEGTGTDLADLDGYSGRVQIELAVQNLTVQPQEVSYDVDGRSRSQNALVGVPLSITASALLPGTDPTSVELDGTDDPGATPATNGVVEDVDGGTQVQWATILAPPQLGSGTRLHLALDAEDFSVPDVRLSVQPGLVTDPSVGSLIDAAFNPNRSQEMELQLRTISVLGDVGAVLKDASKTITKVRTTLESSRDTIGRRVIGDLDASSDRLRSRMSDVGSTIESLGGDVSSSLESAESQTLSTFAQTVQSVDGLIGDTDARLPRVELDGEGCETKVDEVDGTSGIYGEVLRVAALIDAYGEATDRCRVQVGKAVLDGSDALKTALDGATDELEATAGGLTTSVRDATASLNPATIGTRLNLVKSTFDELGRLLGLVPPADPDQPDPDDDALKNLRELLRDKGTIDRQVGEARASLASLGTLTSQAQSAVDTLVERQRKVADDLCDLVGTAGAPEPGKLDAATVDGLRADLGASACPAPGDDPAEPQDDPAQTLLDQLATATGSDSDLAKALDALDDAREEAEEALDDSSGGLSGSITNVFNDGQFLLGLVNDSYGKIDEALKTAEDQFDTSLASARSTQSTSVDDQAAQNVAQLDRLFGLARQGLQDTAGDVVSRSRSTLVEQRGEIDGRLGESAGRISRTVQEGLTQVTAGTSAATRDTAAAARLLTADLADLLTDIGDPSGTGTGLLGAMGTSAATAESADTRVALAAGQTSAYGNARNRDVQGLLLQQAQARAALERQAAMEPFRLTLPQGAEHRTVYTFQLGAAG
jgi:hypothetical protein